MPYHIEIVCVGADLYADAAAAARLLNDAQPSPHELVFAAAPPQYRELLLPYRLDEYSRDDVFARLGEYRNAVKGDRRHLIAIVNGRLKSPEWANLFGSHEAEKGVAVFTVLDFDRYIASREAFLAFFLLRFALSFVCPSRLMHEDSPSCIFHKRKHKRNIVNAVYEGELCDECVKALHSSMNPEIDKSFAAMLAKLKAALPARDEQVVKEKVVLVHLGIFDLRAHRQRTVSPNVWGGNH